MFIGTFADAGLRPVSFSIVRIWTLRLYYVLARITNPSQQERIFTGLKPDFGCNFRWNSKKKTESLLPKVKSLCFLTLLLITVNDSVQNRQFSSIVPQDSLKKRLLMDLTSYNGLNRVDSVRCKITMLRIVSNLSVVRLQCSELSRFGPL